MTSCLRGAGLPADLHVPQPWLSSCSHRFPGCLHPRRTGNGLYGVIGYFLGSYLSLIEFFNFLPRIWGQAAENLVLVAVPAFVFMGIMMERSGIAQGPAVLRAGAVEAGARMRWHWA